MNPLGFLKNRFVINGVEQTNVPLKKAPAAGLLHVKTKAGRITIPLLLAANGMTHAGRPFAINLKALEVLPFVIDLKALEAHRFATDLKALGAHRFAINQKGLEAPPFVINLKEGAKDQGVHPKIKRIFRTGKNG